MATSSRALLSQYYDRKAREYGLGARHIPVGNLGIEFDEVQTAFRNPEELKKTFIDEAKRLAAQGAEVILAACATVNAIVRNQEIREVDGALIMDCNAGLLKTTEAMADLARSTGLCASQRLLYQRPSRKALEGWKEIYGFRTAPLSRT